MKRRTFLMLVTTVALSLPAQAQETRLSAAEIDALLSGNTIEGTWSGSTYKAYYGTNGIVVYVPEGGRPDEGKWRTNADTHEYESWWRSTGWTPYALVRTSDGYAWINGDTLEPFSVLSGNQLSQ